MVGFGAKNIEAIGRAFLCGICSLILREPVQLSCAHRQCKSCVDSKDGAIIKCPQCREETPKKEVMVDRGFKNDMQTLPIKCSLCHWTGFLKEYDYHLQEKHPNPICEHCDIQCDSASNLEQHKLSQCNQITVSCALKDFGCLEPVERFQMATHYTTERHQIAVINFIRRSLNKPSSDQYERSLAMDFDIPPHSSTTDQLQEIYQTIDLLAGGFQTLHEDTQRLSMESLGLHNGLETFNGNFAALQLSIQEQNTFLDGIKINQEVLDQDVASLKQKVYDLQFVSYDGTLIWKIAGVKAKMTDAESERQTSIYSPPFYSSPTGYKMCARLYLNGDGNARHTHMSIFLVLMRSGYDAILKFPFSYKVTFCLYDQTSAQKHIIDSFRPDIRSNSFQRPRSDMNIASGIPKLVSLATIQQENNPYVQDDAMFIKILIDFGDMPKTLLPYAVTLNPGLSANIRQNMIKQEAERRTQQTSTITSLNSQDIEKYN